MQLMYSVLPQYFFSCSDDTPPRPLTPACSDATRPALAPSLAVTSQPAAPFCTLLQIMSPVHPAGCVAPSPPPLDTVITGLPQRRHYVSLRSVIEVVFCNLYQSYIPVPVIIQRVTLACPTHNSAAWVTLRS